MRFKSVAKQAIVVRSVGIGGSDAEQTKERKIKQIKEKLPERPAAAAVTITNEQLLNENILR